MNFRQFGNLARHSWGTVGAQLGHKIVFPGAQLGQKVNWGTLGAHFPNCAASVPQEIQFCAPTVPQLCLARLPICLNFITEDDVEHCKYFRLIKTLLH